MKPQPAKTPRICGLHQRNAAIPLPPLPQALAPQQHLYFLKVSFDNNA